MKLALVLTAVSLLLPVRSFAQPERAPEEARAPVTRITTGSFVLLTSYGLSLGIGANSLDRDNRSLYVPLAGPWIALAVDNRDAQTKAVLVMDGIAQASGALLLASGLVQRRERARARDRQVRITPIAGSRPGIMVSGRF